MRLFAALPVNGEASAELERLLEGFRRMEWPVRWVGSNGLHLTVKFLGEVAVDRVNAVRDALAAATRNTSLLPFTPNELGAFPTLARPRVLWAGYQSEPALELLVHRVEQGTEALGFPVEGRPFRPHVTLGRLREGATLPPGAADQFEGEALHAAFVAERLVLFESKPGAHGPVYSTVDTFSLGS